MAKIVTKNPGTVLPFSVQFNRGYKAPLDLHSTFKTLALAEAYLSSYAEINVYDGQLISVGENDDVKLYIVKSTINGDNITYRLEETGGAIKKVATVEEITAFSTEDNIGKLFYLTTNITSGEGETLKTDYTTGLYVVTGSGICQKLAISSASGDFANDIATLSGKVSELETTVGDATKGLVKDLSDLNSSAIKSVIIKTVNGDTSASVSGVATIDLSNYATKDYVDNKIPSGGGSSGTYIPNAGDDDIVDLQSIKAENLKGKPYNEVLDILLFPEYNASAGALPYINISNPSLTLEVGQTIENASYSYNEGTQYMYIKDGSSYIKEYYAYTTPNVTTIKSSDKVKFGVNTRATEATSYTVEGPTSDKLYEGLFLYKSKGTGSNVMPLAVGTDTKPLDATSKTITGVYKCGKDGTKSDEIYINLEGNLSSTISGTYKDNLTYILSEDTASKPDHSFSTLGSKSVELFVPTGKSYTVKLTATKFNSGNNSFENDKDLTANLNSLDAVLTPKTFKDAAGNDYTVTSYSINTSNIKTEGKFIVKMEITKN